MDDIKNKTIVIFSITHQSAIKFAVKNNLNPEKCFFVTISENQVRLTRSFCELLDETSFYSTSIQDIDSIENEIADIVVINNHLGFHHDIKTSVKLFTQILKPQGAIIGINSGILGGNCGCSPLYSLLPHFKEFADMRRFSKLLSTKGLSNFTQSNSHKGLFIVTRS